MLHTIWTYNLCTDKINTHRHFFFVSKQLNTLQINTPTGSWPCQATKSPFFFAWLSVCLQVDVKSSITYCTLNEFTALIASSGHSVCKHSGVTVHRFALVCCKFLICEGHVRLDSSRRGEEPPVLFSSSLTLNHTLWFSESCQVNSHTVSRQAATPPPHPQPNTLPITPSLVCS